MRLIEFHILQSFPVSCLNRDDVNSPKSVKFGGKSRARISSQCYKRAIRMMAKDILPDHFGGIRAKNSLANLIKEKIISKTGTSDGVEKQVKEILKKNKLDKDTQLFISDHEINLLVEAHISGSDFSWNKDKTFIHAADIALFGRMLADAPDANIEAASMFAHAISTHPVDNEIDFFTAVEDHSDKTGAAHMGMLEYNSAVYYRYAGINLDLLKANLINYDESSFKSIIKAFSESVIIAVPHARKTTMNAHTLPGYIKLVCRSKGSPIQLVNAFEQPIKAKDGLLKPSVEAIENHWTELKSFFEIHTEAEYNMPNNEKTVQQIIDEVAIWSSQS